MSSAQLLIWEKENDSSGLKESDEQRDAPSRPWIFHSLFNI